MSIKLNTTLNAEVSHYPSTVALSGERTKPPAQAMNLQAVAQKLPKLRKTIAKIMASLALSSVFALVPMVAQARPFATWNIQGARFKFTLPDGREERRSNYVEIFNLMNANNLDIMAIQEAGDPNDTGLFPRFNPRRQDSILSNGVYIGVIRVETPQAEGSRVPGSTFYIYYLQGNINGGRTNVAMVVRNPPPSILPLIRPIYVRNPRTAPGVPLDRARPALLLRVDTAYYASIHAQSGEGTNTNNDAIELLNAVRDAAEADLGGPALVTIGLDGNRPTNGPGGVGAVYNPSQLGVGRRRIQMVNANGTTYPARPPENPNVTPSPPTTLDLLATTYAPPLPLATVLNTLPNDGTRNFASDHRPVQGDADALPSFTVINAAAQAAAQAARIPVGRLPQPRPQPQQPQPGTPPLQPPPGTGPSGRFVNTNPNCTPSFLAALEVRDPAGADVQRAECAGEDIEVANKNAELDKQRGGGR
jgi:hypothetical protein